MSADARANDRCAGASAAGSSESHPAAASGASSSSAAAAEGVRPQPRPAPELRLTEVEATAVKVSLFRSLAAAALTRPDDGAPYYDASYDRAIVEACLPASEQAALTAGPAGGMLPFMAVRTAEVDRHLAEALWGGGGGGGGGGDDSGGGGGGNGGGGGESSGGGGNASDTAVVTSLGNSSRGGGGSREGGGAAAAVRQVVLVGAGLDARAWRLPLPCGGGGTADPEAAAAAGAGCTTVYELDSGAVEALKARVLGPLPPGGRRRVFAEVDLEAPGQALAALAAAGHDPHRPTVFVAEGLIGYLTVQAGDALLRGLRSIAAAGSLLLLTTPPSPAWRDELAAQGMRLHHATYEEAEATLARACAQGWDAELLRAEQLALRYRVPGSRFELIVGRVRE